MKADHPSNGVNIPRRFTARAYSPAFGRFMQTDPIGYEAGMNLYAYVENDPVNFTDPSGMDAACFGAVGACGGFEREFQRTELRASDYVFTGSAIVGGFGIGGGALVSRFLFQAAAAGRVGGTIALEEFGGASVIGATSLHVLRALSTSDKPAIVLGLSETVTGKLTQFASRVGGVHLLGPAAEARTRLLAAIQDPGQKFIVRLDGLGDVGADPTAVVLQAIERGRVADYTGNFHNNFTNWEIYRLFEAGRFNDVTFTRGNATVTINDIPTPWN